MLVLNKCFLNIEMISESRLFDYVKILYWSNSTKTMKIQQNFYTPHKMKILFNSYHHIFSKKDVITEASYSISLHIKIFISKNHIDSSNIMSRSNFN